MKAYSDTACHFCREAEDSEHLAQCPVYSTVMRGANSHIAAQFRTKPFLCSDNTVVLTFVGTEFEDIKSKDVARVKRALANIRAALEQRSVPQHRDSYFHNHAFNLQLHNHAFNLQLFSSKALSFTSVGDISQKNMQLLTLRLC